MADTGIDDVKKQRNDEYAKQYRMKRKLLMQEQASTSSEPQLAEKHVLLLHISFLRVLVVLYLRVTCTVYMCSLGHINDPVLSSLKMEGIRLLFNIRGCKVYV
jgi:hypothetical protein